MPMYCYKCPECGHKETDVRPIAQRNEPMACLCCPRFAEGNDQPPARMVRDITAEGCGSGNQEYAKPIYSEAMGVHPDQVQEHRRAHPNIEMTNTGEVVIRSHAEHKRVMKELGFYNKD